MDYRFFPEPDLPPLRVDPAEVAAVRAWLPELPEARIRRIQETHGLAEDEALTLMQSPAFADFFEALAQASGHAKASANWMLGEVSRVLNERGLSIGQLGVAPEALAGLIRLVDQGRLPLGAAREVVFPALLAGEGPAEAIVAQRGLEQVSDAAAITLLVRQVLEAHPDVVAQIRAGRERLRGFLVGQAMKAGGGRLDPKGVNEALDRILPEFLAKT